MKFDSSACVIQSRKLEFDNEEEELVEIGVDNTLRGDGDGDENENDKGFVSLDDVAPPLKISLESDRMI